MRPDVLTMAGIKSCSGRGRIRAHTTASCLRRAV